MRLPEFEYVEPKTLREATKLLSSGPKGSALLAGGTDLLVSMKHQVLRPRRVVNLKTVSGLAYIANQKDGLKIGPLTSLHDLASSRIVRRRYPALSYAAAQVGAYALQAMGTLGGNLCQGNRCRFYNQSSVWRGVRPPCYKTGGNICHVVPVRKTSGRTSGSCHSTYCGDLAPVLIALGSQMRLIGPNGGRPLPLKELFTQSGKKSLSLKPGEILEEVLVPPPSGKTVYLKWRLRDALEFPLIGLALHLETGTGGKIQQAKVIFTGVGPGPVETLETEKMLMGGLLDAGLIEKVSSHVGNELSPMRTSMVSPAYKRQMAGILLKQALDQMC